MPATKKAVKKSASVTRAEKLLGGPVTKQRKVVRDSGDGRFTTKSAAKRDPKGTTTESVVTKKGEAFKIPKTLPECVDLYDQLREQRLAIQKQAEALGKQESELREHLINNISKSTSAGVIGKIKKAVVIVEPKPVVEDEAAYFKFAAKKGNEDLVVHKPDLKAIQERWDAGKTVPGVGKFNIVKLSLTKIK